MSYNYRPDNSFSALPRVVKNLLIVNVLLFLLTYVYQIAFNVDLTHHLGLHYFTSPAFRPHQMVTYMFMHGGLWHILFNMFALFMFGNVLENLWGPKRFLIFYMVTGIGAGLAQLLVAYIRLQPLAEQVSPEEFSVIVTKGYEILKESKNFVDSIPASINLLVNIPTVGASGAVFGILVAFGMLFPNTELMLMFIPIPIKAKYAVILYGALELFLGVANFSGDNVAHFAHLGGALFGFIMVKYWQRNSNRFY
jgi:membrane associated rhomboid family serine protease